MRKLMFRIFVLLVLGIFFYSCGYNTMQKNEEEVLSAWGNVESSLQRRADLIPNLVEVVKGYAAHERETLEAVINARAKATAVNVTASDLGNAQAMQQLVSESAQLHALVQQFGVS